MNGLPMEFLAVNTHYNPSRGQKAVKLFESFDIFKLGLGHFLIATFLMPSALVFGSAGALGRALCQALQKNSWVHKIKAKRMI
jgi:hypothetical protein